MKMLKKDNWLLAVSLAFGVAASFTPASATASGEQAAGTQSYVDQALGTAGQYWTTISDTLLSWLPGLPSGSVITRHLESPHEMSDTDFKYLMSVAGYSIKSVNMDVGIVPRFSLYFGQTREMSEADEIYLARLLRKHERSMGGPVAASQRLIIRTIMQLEQFPDYNLTKVAVTMLPVPSVEFVAEPKHTVLSPDLSYIAQRIKDVNIKLEQMQP
jgi:hypothetical protein